MSQIGQYALELTEKAQEMGFATLQDALDAGFVAEGEELVPGNELAKEVAEGQRIAGLLAYSDSELKNELQRRIDENDRRAPVE